MVNYSVSEILNQALKALNEGDARRAEQLSREVVEQVPNASDAVHILGLALHEQGKYAKAAEQLLHALVLDPDEPDAWLHLAGVREAAGQYPEAIAAYEMAQKQAEDDPAKASHILHLLARAQMRAGRYADASDLWAQRIAENPSDKEAWLAHGKVLSESNQLKQAAELYQRAVLQIPDFFDAWICLGNALRGLGKPIEAADAYRRALEIQPNSALCLGNLAATFLDLGDFRQACAWYEQAIQVQPDYASARLSRCIAELPMLYEDAAALDAARGRYQAGLQELRRHYLEQYRDELPKLGRIVGHTQPFLLPYQQRNDRELQGQYGELVCQATEALYARYAVPAAHIPKPGSEGKIRIAFVGAHFCGHSVWKAITRGWVEQLSREKYELLGYYTSAKQDQQTQYAKRLFTRFVQGPLEAEEWMRRIRQDDPHLIIYPEIGMDPMTAKLAAVRLAPIQCVAWGHPETSGYPSIDYYLSGELLDSADAGGHYTEQLVRLHGTSSHYTPLTVPVAEVRREDFGLADKDVAYLCCQNLFKYLPQYDAVFVRIAQAVPNSRFIFFRHKLADAVSDAFMARLKAAFSAAGLSFEHHCRFNPWLELGEFEAMLRHMDVYLDSIGFSGFNTAMEALGAGLPVVTLEGEFMRGRLASAILRQIKVTDGIADSVDAYVEAAAQLGKDTGKRAKLKKRITASLKNAYEDKAAIRALEKFIDGVCAGMWVSNDPKAASLLLQRAARLLQAGKHAEAEPLLRQAIATNPSYAAAYSNLGVALMALGRSEEGIAAYRQALSVQPDFADAAFNLGRALMKKSRITEAIRYFEQAVELYGDKTATALNGLGNALRTINRPQQALPYAERAVRVDPEFAEAWMNLASTYRDLGRVEEAIAGYEKAISLCDNMPAARLHLCNIMIPQGYRSEREVGESRERYRAALQEMRAYFLEQQPDQLHVLGKVVTSSQPFYLPYQGMNDCDLLKLHGDLVNRAVNAAFPGLSIEATHRPKPDGEGKIRIGFVTGFFRDHSVWKAIVKGWMEKLDRSRFALYAYHTQHYRDKETEYARGLCRRFVQGPLEHKRWCAEIRADDLHILIYPEIGMDPDAAALAAMRLAPVQCATWGHPETSGLPTLDYFISGELLEPADAQGHYLERLVCLPHTSACYAPLPFAPSAKQRGDFGLADDEVVFLSCQNPFKYLPRYDEVFPRIAAAVPSSRFVFFRHKKSDGLNAMFRERIEQAFARHGLSADRHALFLDWQSFPDFQALLAVADVFLDTIGFSGFNTASEALAANLPVVTLDGEFMRGRLAAAILRQIGMDDTVTDSVDEYVGFAVRLGNDSLVRSAIRQRIAKQLPSAYNDLAPVRALENFLNSVATPLVPPPAWHLLTEAPGSDAHAYNHAYAPRGLIDMVSGAPRSVLDVGCFVGATGALIKQRWPESRVVGIEPNPEAAKRAALRIDHVANCVLEEMDWKAAGIAPNSIDMVVLADVLEHFYNPWQALIFLKPWLTPDAQVMISLPNVRNLWLAERLLSGGMWRYERAGLLDVTHIRFFTLAEARRMLTETGYCVDAVRMNPDQRLKKWSALKVGAGATAEVTIGRMTLQGVSAAELAELTTLQFFLRCTLERN